MTEAVGGGSEPPRVLVRDARAQDLRALVTFNAEMARETEDRGLDPEVLTRGIIAVLGDPARGQYLVAEVGQEPVGCLMTTVEWSDWRDGFFWWIQSVYVVPRERGRGVFRALYDRVVELARDEPDVCGIRLYVERENERAKAVYRSCGMTETAYRLYEMELRG